MLNKYIGKNVVLNNVDLGEYIEIRSNSVLEEVKFGDFSYASGYNNIYYTNIGKLCSIASFVNINPGNDSVEIGHAVRIGQNALVMSGVKIGNGAIIKPGSIVTEDVESYSIVTGEPAKKIKMRFSKETIIKIEKSKWWDWDCNKLKSILETFINFNIFITEYSHYK